MNRRFCKRPWGFWITILDRKHFKVKLFRVKPNRSLSKQYHLKRNELWLFLSGIGEFLCEGRRVLTRGDYWLVDVLKVHQYTALSPTWVLEIQYGETCIEEDIVRV